jgi:hypothetical protein
MRICNETFGLSNFKYRIMEKKVQLTLLYKGVDKCGVCVLLAVMDDGFNSLTASFIYRVTTAP